MKPSLFDVAIIGGGPGGSATALSLRTHAPSLRVALVEASHYETPRIGEALPPLARSLLEHLGVWEAFQAQGHREVYGTTAAWGAAKPLDNDFMYMPASTGWHLDRAAFDAMLAGQAERQGVSLILDARLLLAQHIGQEWQLTLSSGSMLRARFLVDATGGAVGFARRCGARFNSADRLVGIFRYFEGNGDDSRTLVEAFEDGWWYTAGLPGGQRIIACLTDADIACRLKLGQTEQWSQQLSRMQIIGAIAQKEIPNSPIVIRSAGSRRLDPAAGSHWLAVGDSASRFDPLSSQGIAKALRSGIFASYAIGDWLSKGDDSGLARYCRYVVGEFTGYAGICRKYYLQENRWPSSEFWRRRHASGN